MFCQPEPVDFCVCDVSRVHAVHISNILTYLLTRGQMYQSTPHTQRPPIRKQFEQLAKDEMPMVRIYGLCELDIGALCEAIIHVIPRHKSCKVIPRHKSLIDKK
jgi:hypothetical protein